MPEERSPAAKWLLAAAAAGATIPGLRALRAARVNAFSPEIRNLVRKGGLSIVKPRSSSLKALFADNEITSLKDVPNFAKGLMRARGDRPTGINYDAVSRWLRRLGHGNINFIDPKDVAGARGAVLDLEGVLPKSSIGQRSNVIGRTLPETIFGSRDKLVESNILKGLIPDSLPVSELVGGRNIRSPQVLARLFDRKFGRGQWFMKARESKQSRGVYAPEHFRPGSEYVDEIRNDIQWNLPDYFVQRGIPTTRYSRFERMADSAASALGEGKYRDFANHFLHPKRTWGRLRRELPSSTMGNAKIYRADLLDGRLISGATSTKSSVPTYLPFRTPQARRVERYANDVAQQLPERYRHGLMGLDIGINPTTRQPFLIEANPSQARNIMESSGSLSDLHGVDSLISRLRGGMTLRERGQLGASGLGSGLLGYAALQ